jgi:hypothetical protein
MSAMPFLGKSRSFHRRTVAVIFRRMNLKRPKNFHFFGAKRGVNSLGARLEMINTGCDLFDPVLKLHLSPFLDSATRQFQLAEG